MKVINSPGSVPNQAMVGSIDESSDLSLINSEKGEIHVDCYEVARINSVGVKKWIAFFKSQNEMGVKVFFYRVSTALVDQFNLISNFGCGGEVVSIMLPFQCKACGANQLLERNPAQIKAADFENISWPCEKCGKPELQFDDDPEGYFFFLQN